MGPRRWMDRRNEVDGTNELRRRGQSGWTR